MNTEQVSENIFMYISYVSLIFRDFAVIIQRYTLRCRKNGSIGLSSFQNLR